ncbi:MAG: zinc-binding dehydrogenase [Bryobacterales bacterium]|nr:zinc-binding dehydrogenase [Bryobacterales bacterium]
MRAIVKTAPGEGHLELLEWREPSPEPDQVKIQIAGVGICGTDIHIVRGNWRCDPPVVLGHEWCGVVAEVGSQVRGFREGDRVVASNPARTCGACFHCVTGNPFMCAHRVSAGYMIDGAFADFLCIDYKRCHHLPDHVSFRTAALGEPLSVAVHAAIERTTVRAGDLVLVSGPGCIGLLTAQVAKLQGAKVVLSGLNRDQRRLECGKALGVDLVVNAEQEDLVELVHDLSGGSGADIVYECAGSPASLETCWKAVRKEGTLAPLGVQSGPILTDINAVMMKELSVVGSYGYVWTSWQRAIRLMAEGLVRADALISHELPLESFAEGFRLTQDGSAIKVVLNPLLPADAGNAVTANNGVNLHA